MSTTTVFDVAKYILIKQGEMTAMKLQKLVYYVKAWGLVWDEEEIFPEEFEAWANGAVCRDLYDKHRRKFIVYSKLISNGRVENIPQNHEDTINEILRFYGKYTAQQLSDINHQESPWKDARVGLEPDERSENLITSAAMHEYYSGVDQND